MSGRRAKLRLTGFVCVDMSSGKPAAADASDRNVAKSVRLGLAADRSIVSEVGITHAWFRFRWSSANETKVIMRLYDSSAVAANEKMP